MDKQERHQKYVEKAQGQLKTFFKQKKQVRVYHGNTNSTRKASDHPAVDISRLNQILEVNQENRYAVVEPNVPLDQLLLATLSVGLMPPEVSEFPGITVGGAIQGGAGESSSFKYGTFHDASLEYEVLLGDGKKVIASPTKNSDLFFGLASSCGSLGIITKVKLALVPTTKFIRLEYYPVASFEAAVSLLKQKTKEPIDFVDGILFSKTSGVVMVGYFDDKPKRPRASFHRGIDEWFYLHASKIASRNEKYTEYIPASDYLFRYDRGAFWVGRLGEEYIHLPFNRLTRILFSPLFTTRNLYRFLHGAGLAQRHLVQDICMPEENTVSFVKFIDKTFGIYPLWLCPLRPGKEDKLSPNTLKTKLVINVGVWDKLDLPYKDFVRLNRKLEQKVLDLHGRKVLYAHSYYPETEFWQIYDKSSYDKLRKKYNASVTFPDVYNKTFVSKIYPEPNIAKGWLSFVKQPYR